MKMQKKQAGFTLIELIVVIVILGILGAVALPRFVNMSAEAREAASRGIQGAVSSAMSIAYAKAALDNQTGATGSITVDGSAVALVYGYPTTASIALMVNSDPAPTGGVWDLGSSCTVTYAAASADAGVITPATVTRSAQCTPS